MIDASWHGDNGLPSDSAVGAEWSEHPVSGVLKRGLVLPIPGRSQNVVLQGPYQHESEHAQS
jgi:hypothetical protein